MLFSKGEDAGVPWGWQETGSLEGGKKRGRRVFGFSLEQLFQVISTQPGLMKNVK
ncbi:MAG: hypothetical protein K8R06_02720 [Methanosarcinales archaeon]|nr:hypothetical protein [Methanosarcinales archaeon]MCD4815298.1 hypothetical protein [Methanosarcinales archaeon]